MDNLPAGAAHDSRAPWNQRDGFCPGCENSEIDAEVYEILAKKYPEEDYTELDYEREYEEFIKDCEKCEQCRYEDHQEHLFESMRDR